MAFKSVHSSNSYPVVGQRFPKTRLRIDCDWNLPERALKSVLGELGIGFGQHAAFEVDTLEKREFESIAEHKQTKQFLNGPDATGSVSATEHPQRDISLAHMCRTPSRYKEYGARTSGMNSRRPINGEGQVQQTLILHECFRFGATRSPSEESRLKVVNSNSTSKATKEATTRNQQASGRNRNHVEVQERLDSCRQALP